jgi:DNA-binding MarR family transcriptional regulator
VAAAPKDVRDLLMYRLARIATVADRSGQLTISRKFGLNLGAWRVLGLIHAFAPVTLTELAGELCLDKGQLSRTISDLTDSGLVRRAAGQRNRRQTFLELTPEGERLHARVLPFVAGRNARMMQPLTASECATLFRLLDKVMTAVTASYEELFGPQPKRPDRPVAAPRRASRLGARTRTRQRGPSREAAMRP